MCDIVGMIKDRSLGKNIEKDKMDIVERLRATPNRPTVPQWIGNGIEIQVPAITYNFEDDALRAESADYIEALRKENGK